MEKKLPLPDLGGLAGVKCTCCEKTFYASNPKSLREEFDKHKCREDKSDLQEPEKNA
jgi:hypothetical protein